MTTIIPQTELLRRAAAWICDQMDQGKKLHLCLDEAGMRFNLSPKDQLLLADLFAKNSTICNSPESGRPF